MYSKHFKNLNLLKLVFLTAFFGLATAYNVTAGKKAFTVEDAMKFHSIKKSIISDDGRWVAWSTSPDRGDPKGFVRLSEEFENDIKYEIERGKDPVFSNDGQWVGFKIKPKEIEELNAEKEKKPKDSLLILNVLKGDKVKFEKISKFVFSEDSKWLVYTLANEKKDKDNKKFKIQGNEIVLRHLESGSELPIQDVTEFIFDSVANYFVYVISEPEGKRNGLYYIKLQGLFNFPQKILKAEKSHYSNLVWNNERGLLAFISAKEDKEGEADTCSLMLWDSRQKGLTTIVDPQDSLGKAPKEGWILPFKNELQWTKDGERLFFGFKPIADTSEKVQTVKYNDTNFYNIDTILRERDYDLWHWNDPRIKTYQKKWWQDNKDNTYMAVYHVGDQKLVLLADLNLPSVVFTENPNNAIGYDETPYLKEITWDASYKDIYIVNLLTGTSKKVVEHSIEDASISPNGYFLAFFKQKHWYIYDSRRDSILNLTSQLPDIPFYDIEYDEPGEAPSYGLGGWLENDQAVLLYDEFDIWKFYVNDEGYINMTAANGKIKKIKYRILHLDPDKRFFKVRDDVVVSAYYDLSKTSGIARINMSVLGPETIVQENNKINVIAKAKGKLKFLYYKQTYSQFPDVWVADSTFFYQLQVSDVHPELKDYNYGTTELVSWVNADGDSLRGWVIKPENWDPAKKYPMLVYFYDKFSDYYNTFFTPKLNHRPCYPIYTGKGYMIFHPDIKYTPGNPGQDATDCIVSGVKNLIKQGSVDTNAIGIQGHSWGGYQTAFIITQTDIFKAACAGAPVGNMTSAYGGIRYGSGLARQFQYESAQSRIGGTLWDSLDNYINNSPIFQANKVKTPFLMMFGDEDPAVPWQQGIELYLAMRRLNKQCYFLEYRGEPHWPEKYPNKLDYAEKMMQFYDHFLLGKPAPDWMTKGVEYRGR